MIDILKLEHAHNSCPHCNGTGKLPHPNVGFALNVGDLVEDHVGIRVRIDHVDVRNPTLGWGTTLNAPAIVASYTNHNNHRVDTNNDYYNISLWTKIDESVT